MTLLEFAHKKIKPTADQEKAFQALDTFLDSDCRCFLLKGYAGTGKTTITKTIAQYIDYLKWETVLMAPTGRAARILNEKTGMESTTIHRAIYNLNDVDEIEIKVGGKKQFKFRFNLNTVSSSITRIYIFDEASMISDKKSEQDFFIFGSGILLKDIFEAIAPQNIARKDKMIFVGDPAQLPPVSDPISGALSAYYLKEKYDINTLEYEMTQVVRQEQKSGILFNAGYLRKRLFSNEKKATFKLTDQLEDVHFVKPEEVASKYLSLNPDLLINKTAIVSFSNKSALEYNLKIREQVFKNKYQIAKGDLLIINQNNYNYDTPLYNGTMVKVKGVNSVPKVRSNIKSYNQKGEERRVDLKFREVILEVPFKNEPVNVSCLILDDFLYSEDPQLAYEEHIALYLDFKYRHPQLKPKTQQFKDTLRKDPYFNALKVKYGYGITCHKAQGGEWESVLVNMDLKLGRKSDPFNRWLYTAITRAKNQLFLFNYNPVTRFSKLKVNFHYPENGPMSSEDITFHYKLTTTFEQRLEQFGLDKATHFQQEKFKDVMARAEHFGYEVLARNAHNYQEQYTFEKDGERGTLVFWYGGKNKFTRTTIFNSPQNDMTFCNQLLQQFTQPINILYEEQGIPEKASQSLKEDMKEKEILFPERMEFLSVLYDNLKDTVGKKDIQITDLQHDLFNEIYSFQRAEEKAAVKCYYNGEKMFTSVINLNNKCNSSPLLKDIETAFLTLKSKK